MRRVLLLCLSLGCVPHPQSVREARAHFPRESLKGSVILPAAPSALLPVRAVFDDRVELLGLSLSPEHPRAGDAVEVRYYFGVRRPIFDDFEVFVHGDASGGPSRRIFGDHWPARGTYPTGMWQVGEVIEDHFSLSIPGDYAGARLRVYSGLYRDDFRLPLTEAGAAPSDRENRSLVLDLSL